MIQRTFFKFINYLQRKRGKSGGKDNTEPRGKENISSRDVIESDSKDGSEIISENREKLPPCTENEEIQAELAYEIKNSEIMGRYLVASRDLQPGDLIIKADPLVVGPCAGCDIICLGCYHPIVTRELHHCTKCKWPICAPSCLGYHQPLGHSVQECAVLEKHCKLDMANIKDLYHAIVPLRCLLLKTSDPEKWITINKMVAHNDIRREKADLWRFNQSMVVDRIRKAWGMAQHTEDEIHTICGILEVNAFEVGPLGSSLRALYPRAYLLAHDCTPNTTHTDDARRRLSVRAARNVKRGEPITLSYAYTLQNTHKRREHLLESKFFECKCARCTDPLELGTYAGALLCPRCTKGATVNGADVCVKDSGRSSERGGRKNDSNRDEHGQASKYVGVVLPIDPLDPTASWKCDTCSDYTLTCNLVNALVQRISDEYDAIDVNDVDGFESFLRRYRNVLHANHCLCLSAKLALSQLYGKVDSHLIHKMSPSQLERKRDICRDILKVFDVIEPGFSRLRGTTLYELHAPLMVLTTRDYEKREITKAELRTRLIEVARCLDESAKILNMEPKDSSEGIMATAAKDALRQIKEWEKIIGKIL